MKFYESGDSRKPVIFLFPGTRIHVFYATKMGKKYEKRYCTYFKNPDIRRHNMQHEELFCCHSAEWVEEVRKAVEGNRQ